MIATQQIKSTTSKPIDIEGFEAINVLKWNNSKWKALCPYYLKTDGNELCLNGGGILFENFYQGMKVYDVLRANKVYPSKYHTGNPKYLWWEYNPISEDGDTVYDGDNINYDLYYGWRNSLWNCPNPIRYPNTYNGKKFVQFALCIDKDGNETRMDYVTLRKQIYMVEYTRLIRQLPEYGVLLNKLQRGENIMICEVDVPANGKRGCYGVSCDANGVCVMTIAKVEMLLEDTSESFGHGLCLAYALLQDLRK
jgi:hypothetical protein